MGIKAKIASLVVELSANSAKYNAELDKSKKTLGAWANDAKKKAKVGGVALAGAATAAAGALTLLTMNSMKSINATADFADKIGISTKALAALRLQAEQNGTSASVLDSGLERLSRRASQAAKGFGAAASSIAELGIDAKELNKLAPDKQFHAVAEALERVSKQGDKNRLASNIFGINANEIINMMQDTAKETERAAKEADALGLSVSRIDAEKIGAANTAIANAKRVLEGLGNTIAIKVAPFIADIKNRFYEAALQAGGFGEVVDKGMKVAVKAAGFLANAVQGIKVAWAGLKMIVAGNVAALLTGIEQIGKGIVWLANVIPGVNIKLAEDEGIVAWASAARDELTRLRSELHETAMQKMPSEMLEEYVANVQKVAQAAAETAVKTKQSFKSIEPPEPLVLIDVDRIEKELQVAKEHFAEAYRRRQEMLDQALQSEQISAERHQQISLQNFKRFQDEQAEYKREVNQMMLSDSQSFFSNLATLSQHGNKRMAAIGKAMARISVALGTIDAAQSSFAHASKWGGYPAGFAAAAAATVAGLMRLRQINTAGSGSISGGSGGLSGGTVFDQNLPNASVTSSDIKAPEDRRDTESRVIIQGDYYAQGSVQAMDSQSFAEFAQRNRRAIADATESELNEYGRSLAG